MNAYSRLALVVSVLSFLVISALGQTSTCIETAERDYAAGQISKAIRVLNPCWQKLEKGDRLKALRLLALSYMEDGQRDSTEQSVKWLLKEDRRYRPDPANDPVYFMRLVDELRPPPWYMKKWVWAVGGVAVGGVVSYLVLRPGPEPLPGPGGLWPPQ